MATKLDEYDAPLKPAPRPKPSFKRFFPVVNHYVRFDTQDLDPTVCAAIEAPGGARCFSPLRLRS